MQKFLLLVVSISISSSILSMDAEQRRRAQEMANEQARMALHFAQAAGRPVTVPTPGASGPIVAQIAHYNAMAKK